MLDDTATTNPATTTGTDKRWRRSAMMRRIGLGLWYGVVPFMMLVGVWEGVRVLIDADPKSMPSIASGLIELGSILQRGVLAAYLWRTVSSILIAGAICTALGLSLGTAIGFSDTFSAYAMPVLRYFNALAGIAWLPLFLVWFGFNRTTLLLTVGYTFIFPVIFNTVIGIRTVPKVYRHAVRTMGGSRWDVIRGVLLPGALPSILAGLRMGFGYGWRAAIVAEIITGVGGVGFLIFQARISDNIPRILAGMVIIGLTWAIMDKLLLQPIEESTVRRWAMIQR